MSILKWNDKKLRKVAEDEAMQRLTKVGFMIEREAKHLCPVDTGRLRASISTAWKGGPSEGKTGTKAHEGDGVKAPTDELTVVVGTNVEYSTAVEFGKGKRKPKPYLRPAFRGVLRFIKKTI